MYEGGMCGYLVCGKNKYSVPTEYFRGGGMYKCVGI
jgi:hypothetical protein